VVRPEEQIAVAREQRDDEHQAEQAEQRERAGHDLCEPARGRAPPRAGQVVDQDEPQAADRDRGHEQPAGQVRVHEPAPVVVLAHPEEDRDREQDGADPDAGHHHPLADLAGLDLLVRVQCSAQAHRILTSRPGGTSGRP
jgi:hypothetical protein